MTSTSGLSRYRFGSASLITAAAVLASCLALLVVGVAPRALASPGRDGRVVPTRQGLLKGTSDGAVDRFAGVPYAAPPVGALRFSPPQPAAPWHGVRAATTFGSECPQASGGSEDCLYLNVYTPAHRVGQRLPVMVFVPGGAFVSGDASTYDATPLVRQGNAVVVTINYRLGILGALALPQLDAGTHGLGSGAYGLLDQQAALRWVQQNIAAFGGNRHDVTLFGESAGATYTCLNVVSPSAAGLLQGAIAESGCGLPTTPKPQAEQFGGAIAQQLGCGASPNVDLACLRAKSPNELNAAAAAVAGSAAAVQLASIPAVGGGALPLSVQDALRTGRFNHVPMIVGTNHDEGRLFVDIGAYGPIPTDQASYLAAIQGTITPTTGKSPAAVAAEYPTSRYPSPAEALSAAVGDSAFSCTTLGVDKLASEKTLLFSYEFTDPNAPSPLPTPPASLGATHGTELTYLFNLAQTPQLSPAQQVLSHQLIRYWTTFARTHQPNGPGTPLWLPNLPFSPLIQNLAPGAIGPRPASAFAADHHCGFWGAAG